MNRKSRILTQAFSLVEIALAIGVISFAVLGLLGLMASTQSTVRQSIDRTDNSLLFQKVVNQLKVKPFDTEQSASTDEPSVLPLPALNAAEVAAPFLVNERYDYMGGVDDPATLAAGNKVVRVTVLDATDLDVEAMREPTKATDNQIATVRIEIFGPAAAYRPADEAVEGQQPTAPDHQVFHTSISRVEQ